MKILVCGHRDFTDTKRLYAILDEANPSAIIQGGARGADSIAGLWAEEHGVPNIRVDANWDYYKRAAGPIRNRWMLKFCNPDKVIAFLAEGSKGTRDMINAAQKEGVETIVYEC